MATKRATPTAHMRNEINDAATYAAPAIAAPIAAPSTDETWLVAQATLALPGFDVAYHTLQLHVCYSESALGFDALLVLLNALGGEALTRLIATGALVDVMGTTGNGVYSVVGKQALEACPHNQAVKHVVRFIHHSPPFYLVRELTMPATTGYAEAIQALLHFLAYTDEGGMAFAHCTSLEVRKEGISYPWLTCRGPAHFKTNEILLEQFIG